MDQILAEPELKQPSIPKTTGKSDVKFENVSLSYEKDKEKQAISNVSFHARQGEVTEIVGPSGGGKSTIAHLIPRFFDVEMCIRDRFRTALLPRECVRMLRFTIRTHPVITPTHTLW